MPIYDDVTQLDRQHPARADQPSHRQRRRRSRRSWSSTTRPPRSRTASASPSSTPPRRRASCKPGGTIVEATSRQHRHRAGHGRRRPRLQRGAHHARDHVQGAPGPAARLRGRAGPDAGCPGHEGRGGQGRGDRRRARRRARAPVRQRGQPRDPPRDHGRGDLEGHRRRRRHLRRRHRHRRHDHRRRAGAQGAQARACR